jgi:hypothetical protein
MNNIILTVFFSVSFLLTGCGGSSGNGGSSDLAKPLAELNTGVFLDSAVSNLSYKTASQNDVTDSQGKFSYIEGETVAFSIGTLNFPVVKAEGVITPMTLSGNSALNNPQVTNIAILLQSFDENGNPDDGITIPEGAAAVASAIDLSVPTADFINNAAVINMIANSGSTNTTLVSAQAAQDHLKSTIALQTPYVRSWTNKAGSSESHLILFPDNTFVYAENDDEAPNGLELGRYSYDTISQNLTLSITYDTNGPGEDSGVGNIGQDLVTDVVFSNTNNTMTILNGEFELAANDLSTSTIVGAWSITNPTETEHLVHFADNTFIYVENDSDEPNGLELGTYSYDEGTVEITYTITYDDNGPGQDSGVGDVGTPAVFPISLSDDANTLQIGGTDENLNFSRSL